MPDDGLDKFIDEILTTKKVSGISDEVRLQLISDMKSRLLDQINRALISALPDEKVSDFSLLLDNESISDDEVQRFMIDSGLDVKRITVEVMLAFRGLYLQENGK